MNIQFENAMASTALAQAELGRLRRDIAKLEGRTAEAERMAEAVQQPLAATAARGSISALRPLERGGCVPLGSPSLDTLLHGGLPLATLHEVRTRASRDGGAAAGFVLALIARMAETGRSPTVLWISEASARQETGSLYAPGLLALGLDPSRIVEVAVRTQDEALWAFEAALACHGLGAAVCELRRVSLALTATRRCVLRARQASVTGFLLRLASEAEPSAADLRFRVAPAASSHIGPFPEGVGRMAWRMALEKNRGGRTASFKVEWNAHERRFAEPRKWEKRANPQSLPAALVDRPHPAAGAGERREEPRIQLAS